MKLVERYADWWNVPMHQLDRLEGARAAAGGARVSIQVLVTLITDEQKRDEVLALAGRRFGRMGEDAHLAGSPAELVGKLEAFAAVGVERVYTWFTDFAAIDTLATFGGEVIPALR